MHLYYNLTFHQDLFKLWSCFKLFQIKNAALSKSSTNVLIPPNQILLQQVSYNWNLFLRHIHIWNGSKPDLRSIPDMDPSPDLSGFFCVHTKFQENPSIGFWTTFRNKNWSRIWIKVMTINNQLILGSYPRCMPIYIKILIHA